MVVLSAGRGRRRRCRGGSRSRSLGVIPMSGMILRERRCGQRGRKGGGGEQQDGFHHGFLIGGAFPHLATRPIACVPWYGVKHGRDEHFAARPQRRRRGGDGALLSTPRAAARSATAEDR